MAASARRPNFPIRWSCGCCSAPASAWATTTPCTWLSSRSTAWPWAASTTISEGPFYSTQDADSEGVEGKFFVWSAQEIEEVLGKELADIVGEVYGVTADGNWDGHNILHRSRSYEQSTRLLKISEDDLRRQLNEARQKLFAVRSRRVAPGRDEKVLTAWNGLMINAFAQAA